MERINGLNPNAQPWDPRVDKASEDERTIYFTFSKGCPLPNKEIRRFFTRNYGDCIELVYIHNQNPRKAPLFGKVIFTKCSIPAMIFGDQEEKHLIINKKSLWCKRYKNIEVRRQ